MVPRVLLTPASPRGGAAAHCAPRQRSVGASRWWTMRWPQHNAVSLVGRAGALSPGKTHKLMRALRRHALNYLGQLWVVLASDRRHAKDATAQTAELKADWCRVQKLLGKSRDKAGSLMPGWIVVQRRPTYVITRQLDRWTQLSLLRVSDGSQRSTEGYFSRVPSPPKPTRPAAATPVQKIRTSPHSRSFFAHVFLMAQKRRAGRSWVVQTHS